MIAIRGRWYPTKLWVNELVLLLSYRNKWLWLVGMVMYLKQSQQYTYWSTPVPATSDSKMKLFFSTITLKQNHINILVPVSAILILITCKCKFWILFRMLFIWHVQHICSRWVQNVYYPLAFINVKKFTQTKIENREVNTVYAVIYKYVMKTWLW